MGEVENDGVDERVGDVYEVALGVHRNPGKGSPDPRAPRDDDEPAPDDPEPPEPA